jgi:hypothetical protein
MQHSKGEKVRRIKIIVVAIGITLIVVGNSSAGWVGSPYAKEECTYLQEQKSLYCEKITTSDTFKVEQMWAPAPECPTTFARIVERQGWFTLSSKTWSMYRGKTPLAKNQLQSNDSETFFWHDYTDTVMGCA